VFVSYHGVTDARRKLSCEVLDVFRNQFCVEILSRGVFYGLLDPFLLQSRDRSTMSSALPFTSFEMKGLTWTTSGGILPYPEGRSSLEICTDG
jgi:hypothetical protein